MSLPNYLANIKSSGIYRFVWDKSQVPAQTAETLRLVVGYSEKGPFNTPVYIETIGDFISIFGNVSKRLERRGVFFHRMAIQALAAGPILALNLKPFVEESVTYTAFGPADLTTEGVSDNFINECKVVDLYDRNRFWTLNPDKLPSIGKQYINIFSTDVKDTSCTIFVRPFKPANYNLTLQQWFGEVTDEPAGYLTSMMQENLQDFFAEIYVFRGEFTDSIKQGVLNEYFTETGELKTDYKNIYGELTDALEVMSTDSRSNFIAKYRGCTIPYFKDTIGNYISLDVLFNADYNVHGMLMKFDEEMLENSESESLGMSVSLEMNGQTITETGNSEGGLGKSAAEILKFTGIEDSAYVFNNNTIPNLPLKPVYMKGYIYDTIKKSEKGSDLIGKLLEVLNDKGIRTALTNRVDVEYHYIVDTFQSYVNENKSALAKIAKEKDNVFAILNFPPMQDFVDDSNYTSQITKKFDINLIPVKYSLASEVNGASYCAYYTQVLISDGTLKSVIPSAALVSNNFMEKWSSRQPYYIVAGPTYGRITCDGLVGPDYNFGRSDLDVLEPMGVNAIVYIPRKGTFINSNQTAKQNPVSALSKVHVRELVIFLQDQIASMLENYHWELNTQALRDVIKAKADSILETVKNNGGVYEYLNVCNESNNTPEVVDNEMLVLDTHIEPARGAGKMIHNLTIYRTGEMSSLIK